MAVSRELMGRIDWDLVRECLRREKVKRLGLGGEKLFFLNSEFLWGHEFLFD
jgi:hypothetical protein